MFTILMTLLVTGIVMAIASIAVGISVPITSEWVGRSEGVFVLSLIQIVIPSLLLIGMVLV